MGLDLTLLPLGGSPVCPFAHTLLFCDRNSELFELVQKIEQEQGIDAPEGLITHLSRAGYATNLAVWAYLPYTPKNTLVALYWH